MHLAKALGRYLVLPPFFFHESDRLHNKKRLHPPSELRVNSEGIENLVSMADWYKHCGRKVDGAFLATDIFHAGLTSRVLIFSHDTEIKILEASGRGFDKNVKTFPDMSEIKGDDGDKVQKNWETYFGQADDIKCAAFILPFRTILRPEPKIQYPKEAYDYSSLVVKLAKGFMEEFPGITLGVHWRYNRGDWSHRCYRPNKPPE